MNTRRRPTLLKASRAALTVLTVLTAVIAVGGALLGTSGSAFGQSSAAPPARAALPDLPGSGAGAASAPRVGPLAPRPRPRSLSEAADQASPPGELRPERPVTPQLSIPLGRTPPAAAPGPGRSVRRDAAATPASGGVDDAAARCESLEGSKQRSACRVRAERALPTRVPPAPN